MGCGISAQGAGLFEILFVQAVFFHQFVQLSRRDPGRSRGSVYSALVEEEEIMQVAPFYLFNPGPTHLRQT